MKITFLGTGSAFTAGDNNWQSNILLEKDGKRLLLDCGTDIRFSLRDSGYSINDIDDVYISHLHADHIGGLEFAGFSTYFHPDKKKIRLHISKSMVSDLWQTLKHGLGSIEGKVMEMPDYFEVKPIRHNGRFVWQGISFTLIQVIHTMNGFAIVPSFGLAFEVAGKKVFWTSDTQHAPNQITRFYEQADLIFQDCETAPFRSGVHAHFEELRNLPEATREKMWLYHYQPGSLPDAKAAGFQGFVRKGQTFEF